MASSCAGTSSRVRVPRILARHGSHFALALFVWFAPLGALAQTESSVARAALWPRVAPALPSQEARVEALLARMTLKEKIGQIIMAEIQHVSPREASRYHLGGVLNGGGSYPGLKRSATADEWSALADAYYNASTTGRGTKIPVLWGTDAVHGHNNVRGATLFPHNIGLGATRNAELVREIGRVTARELLATGLAWTFAPTIAVVRDDRWGRSYEGYSESPELVAELGAAMVEGLQGRIGENWLARDRVLATVKHFIGDGGTKDGDDQGDNLASEEELARIHGASYRSTLAAGAQVVMASFNSWRGQKAHGSYGLLSVALKQQMGFDGFVLGDWNGHEQVPGCSVSSCATSLNAGLDMFMVPEDWKALYRTTLAQVRVGEVPMARLDDAVRRILRVKARAGLLDGRRPSEHPMAGDASVLGHPEHRALARRAARESLVLLKNNAGLLPLSPARRVLVMGEAANEIARQSGGWSVTWQGTEVVNADFPGATTIYQGIAERVTAAGGVASHIADFAELPALKAPAARPEVAILIFGETPYAEFEGDLPDLDFEPENDTHLHAARRLRAAGVPVVSIFLSGRPLFINPELNASDALIAAWLPGSEGAALADLLFAAPAAADGAEHAGHYDFSGRLAFSWPAAPDQAPQNVSQPGYTPLFPFGYGLSYAEPGEVPLLPE